MRLMTWNLRAPRAERAEAQVAWCVEQGVDVAVFTELRLGAPGSLALGARLQDQGYEVFWPMCPHGEYSVAIASRFAAERVRGPFVSLTLPGRAMTVLLSDGPCAGVRIAALYVPSRGPAVRRNQDKRAFQFEVEQILDGLGDADGHPLIVAGDLNVVSRYDLPRHAVFGEWEYAFYDRFSASGLHDCHRVFDRPDNEWSWFGRSGRGFRFDYIFVSQGLLERVERERFDHRPLRDGLSDHSPFIVEMSDAVAIH